MKFKIKIIITFLIYFSLNLQFVFAQNHAVVRIATYNILNYPDNYVQRNSSFATVINEIEPDVLVVQEITSQFAVSEFLSSVLGSDYVAGPFINGPDTDNAIYFKDSLFTLLDNRNIGTQLRDISEFTIKHKFSGDTLIIYSVHLKASDGVTNEQKRLAEVTILRNITDTLPIGTNFMVIGDFNIYYSGEPAYQKLINQSTTGYFFDTQPAGNWHNNIGYASIHTQSTCGLFSGCPNGGSGGGLDDRFDMILFSPAVSDTGGITYIDNSYTSFGNDGQHFNKGINEPPFNIITQQVANALYNSSDHLPVYADFDFGIVSDVEIISENEMSYVLQQNYPNPFNPATTIKFSVPEETNVTLTIYNTLGEKVTELVNDKLKAGRYSYKWDAENVSTGMYIYELRTEKFVSVKKMMLIK